MTKKPSTPKKNTEPQPEQIAPLPIYKPIFPSKFSAPSIKVLTELNKIMGTGEQELSTGKDLDIKCSAVFLPVLDDENSLLGSVLPSRVFTEYDRAVFSSVCSLLLVGNEYMSADAIYKVMTGQIDGDHLHITDEQKNAVVLSMCKLRHIEVALDTTEAERQMGTIPKGATSKVKGVLVSSVEREVTYRGTTITAFAVAYPFLLEYACRLKQVIAIPRECLQIGGSNTPERIAVRFYLLRRILARTKKMPNVILYETLYKAAGIDMLHTPKKRLERKLCFIRDFIHDCLEALQSMGYISCYAINSSPSDKKNVYYSIKFEPSMVNSDNKPDELALSVET